MIECRFYLIILCFCGLQVLEAQDPSYFVLGETALKNADIYSIHQNNQGKLFIGTNQGLYEYRFGRMQAIPNATNQKGTAIFNLVSNSQGRVFCSNLNGQIFEVKAQGLELIFQIPWRSVGSLIEMAVDDLDRLILGSNGAVAIRELNIGKPWQIDEAYFGEHLTVKVQTIGDGKVYLNTFLKDGLFQISNGQISPFETIEGFEIHREQFIYLEGKIYLASELDEINRTKTSFRTGVNNYSYRQFNQQEIWRRSYTSGLDLLSLVEGEVQLVRSFFPNLFISHIYEDQDGVLYLGTFGKGLLVIPDRDVITYPFTKRSNIQGIAAASDGKVYLSDINKEILSFEEGQFETVFSNEEYIPNELFVVAGLDQPIHPEHPELVLNINAKYTTSALKSVEYIDPSTLLMASSGGILKWGETTIVNDSFWVENSGFPNTYFCPNIPERCNDAVYDPVTNTIYVATLSALFFQSDTSSLLEFIKNDQSIVVNDLELKEGDLWCATQDHGIMVFKDNKLVKQWDTDNGLPTNFINKLRFEGDQLFIAHKTGFQVLNLETETWAFIGKAEGVPVGSVRDFSIGPEQLWFLTSDNLISRPIKKENKQPAPVLVLIDSANLSRQIIDLQEYSRFPHNQNELWVYLSASNILFEDETQLLYRLIGLDEEWRTKPLIDAASLHYEYLPPGSYTLELKTSCRAIESEALELEFFIQAPYYQQWWFYSLLSLGLIGIVTWAFWRRARLQEQKIKQQQLLTDLAESELRALRAQMNPHFIFNSLNAIQNLILKKDTEASYDYIVLFSDLVRNALNYSQEGELSIGQECQFLETYLKLEKLRFGDDLSYSITCNIDQGHKIPSLIVQPFVENALVHGLFHKKGAKEITIDFAIDEQIVQCTISDNGVGRQRAQEIASRQKPGHRSYAFQAIQKRMEILQTQHDLDLKFELIDQYENDQAVGTTVVVNLPLL